MLTLTLTQISVPTTRVIDAILTLYGPDGAELARARATWIAI